MQPTHPSRKFPCLGAVLFSPTVPQYQALFSVDSNASTVWVDWSGTFVLNGQLKEYVVTDGGRRVYNGLDTTLYIPRTVDKS